MPENTLRELYIDELQDLLGRSAGMTHWCHIEVSYARNTVQKRMWIIPQN